MRNYKVSFKNGVQVLVHAEQLDNYHNEPFLKFKTYNDATREYTIVAIFNRDEVSYINLIAIVSGYNSSFPTSNV